ncbi:RNA polymerase-binding protein DksA [Moraxella boevrei]|uniref:RNA polymerase-binding protein DksA n=1 Tax=Faucicola boevrei TaxID=346665 RepID=UPI003734D362
MTATQTEQNVSFTPYQAKDGEEYMNDAQLEHFIQILEAWKAQLLAEAESTKSYIQDESTAMPDINDRATQEEEFALALRTRDRERKLIRKIDKSLAEIESGDYGFCETCGVEIGLRRLEARPTATQCIDCKTLSEIKEKQAWGHA